MRTSPLAIAFYLIRLQPATFKCLGLYISKVVYENAVTKSKHHIIIEYYHIFKSNYLSHSHNGEQIFHWFANHKTIKGQR